MVTTKQSTRRKNVRFRRKASPDFSLEGSDGKRHTLATYTGRYVVLYFYPKDNTPGCTKESCGFRDLSESFDNYNTTILGISKDDIASHHAFIDDFNLPFVCSLTLIPR